MKTSMHKVTVIGAAALLAGGATHAQDWADNLHGGQPYISGGIGPDIQQNLYIRNLGRSVGVETGVRGDLSMGYNILDNLAVELQTGASENRIRSWNTAAFGGNTAYLDQVPLLANVIFRAPLLFNLTPYVGAGAGGVVSELSVRQYGHWEDDADVTFAYQGMAGVDMALNRHIDLGLGYRFLGTPDHVWFADDPSRYTPTGKTLSHTILATLSFSF